MFEWDNGYLKINSCKVFTAWETTIFIKGVKLTIIKSNDNLLSPAHRNKVEKELAKYYSKKEKQEVMLQIMDDYNKWEETDADKPISLEALDILCDDPIGFLLSETQKLHSGDDVGLQMYIYSLMSLNDGVGYFINIEVLGKSGGGKSHGQKVCKKLLPDENCFPTDNLSAKSLIYYSKDHSLRKKLLIMDDVVDKDIDLLKQAGNNGLEPFSYATVIEGHYVEMKADASPLIWISKVSPLEDEGGQIASRFLVFNIDETKEQRYNILDNILKDEHVTLDPKCKEIVKECINLEIDRVICPDYEMPDKEKIGYRDANFFKALIKCCALLNHMKREIKNNVLYATLEDVNTIDKLWTDFAVYNRYKLDKKQVKVFELIPDDIAGISTTQLRELTGIPRSTLYVILEGLERRELIKKLNVGRMGYYYRNE